MTRTLLIFILLSIIAIFGCNYAYQWITNEYIVNQTFKITFNWIYWAYVITWSFYLVTFIVFGALLTKLTNAKRPIVFAPLLGIVYSSMRAFWNHNYFSNDADFWVMFWVYGEYVMPVIGSILGAYLIMVITNHSARTLSANALRAR